MSSRNNGLSAAQVLLPIALLSLVVFISLAFQTTQIFTDRSTLHQIKTQQDKPLEDTLRLQTQLTALAQGTLKLAQQGDKDAQSIIDRLKKAGVNVELPKDQTKIPAAPPAHVATPAKQP
jgi:hypothetical protein